MKKSIAAAALALGLLTPACLGPDNLYGGIKNWNANVAKQDWLNEVIFVGFWILPVYPLAALGDILIFNTIEYWTGDNPVSEPEPFPGFKRES